MSPTYADLTPDALTDAPDEGGQAQVRRKYDNEDIAREFIEAFGGLSPLRKRADDWVYRYDTHKTVQEGRALARIRRELVAWLVDRHKTAPDAVAAARYKKALGATQRAVVEALAIHGIERAYTLTEESDAPYTIRTDGWGLRLDVLADILPDAQAVWDPAAWDDRVLHEACVEPGYSAQRTAAAFDPHSPAPHPVEWERFIHSTCGGDRTMKKHLQQLAGYFLTEDVESAPVFTFLYGVGQNGKSTYIETLGRVLGVGNGHYSEVVDASVFLRKRSGSAPSPDVIKIKGKRLVKVTEMPDGKPLDAARLKSMTGGDTLTGRNLYGDPQTFLPVCKMVSMTNHPPILQEEDDGSWRRLALIPFTQNFPIGKRDGDLKTIKLPREIDGIFWWCVEGFVEWWKAGRVMQECPQAQAAKRDLRTDNGMFQRFLDEECEVVSTSVVRGSDFRDRYNAFRSKDGAARVAWVSLKESVERHPLLVWEKRAGGVQVHGVRFKGGE